jgi:hypothetical protein
MKLTREHYTGEIRAHRCLVQTQQRCGGLEAGAKVAAAASAAGLLGDQKEARGGSGG